MKTKGLPTVRLSGKRVPAAMQGAVLVQTRDRIRHPPKKTK